MASNPTRPDEKPKVSDHERAIIMERLKTVDDEDAKTAVDARKALADIRKTSNTPPRVEAG